MIDLTRPSPYASLRARAAGTTGHVHASEGRVTAVLDGSTPTADGDLALWYVAIDAPAAADLLALLVPVVERLREVAADELLGTEAGL